MAVGFSALFLVAGSARAQAMLPLCPSELAHRWTPPPPLEERFALLYGRSFYRSPDEVRRFHLELPLRRRDPCLAPTERHLLRVRTVLRLSSANEPPSPSFDETGRDIELVYHALHGADLSTVTIDRVQQAIDRSGANMDAQATAFVLKYLTATTNRQELINQARARLSMAQMVEAARYYGYLASLRYDYDKANSIDRPIVSPSQVTNAAEAALTGKNLRLTAGDCADVANAQADLLQKLGAKDVYVITSAIGSGLHSTVIARDPHQQIYYELNFDHATRTAGRDGADLPQLPGDGAYWTNLGTGFYFNEPNGRTVAYVPTNAGKVYAEAAGMDIHAIEPLARATSSFTGAQLELPWDQTVQAFAARDPAGSYYAGLALTQSWAQRTIAPGAVGVVTAFRETASGVSVADFYLHLDQRAMTPSARLGPFLRARLDGAFVLVGSYALPLDEDLGGNDLAFDAAMLIDGGAQLSAGTPGSLVSGRARVDVQITPGLMNIAGAAPTVFVNHVMFSTDGRLRLVRGRELYLVAAAAAVVDHFGTRLAGGLGFESRRIGVRLEATGRALESDAVYEEGSLRRGRLLVGWSVHRYVTLSLSTEIQELDPGVKGIVMGGFNGHF